MMKDAPPASIGFGFFSPSAKSAPVSTRILGLFRPKTRVFGFELFDDIAIETSPSKPESKIEKMPPPDAPPSSLLPRPGILLHARSVQPRVKRASVFVIDGSIRNVVGFFEKQEEGKAGRIFCFNFFPSSRLPVFLFSR